jgi:hypothetical protein
MDHGGDNLKNEIRGIAPDDTSQALWYLRKESSVGSKTGVAFARTDG